MSSVKKEARLSGLLLARKGAAQPAHTDHRLTVHAVDPIAATDSAPLPAREFYAEHSDTNILVEAVKEINDVTKRQYNDVLNAAAKEKAETSRSEEKIVIKNTDSYKKKEITPEKNDAPANKRIAMTLRMEHEDHLKLRLYAAHSRKSCQEIISDALEKYLCKDGKVCGLSDCNCLTK